MQTSKHIALEQFSQLIEAASTLVAVIHFSGCVDDSIAEARDKLESAIALCQHQAEAKNTNYQWPVKDSILERASRASSTSPQAQILTDLDHAAHLQVLMCPNNQIPESWSTEPWPGEA